ncbi:LuxR family transcriptional regulator [Eggerthella sinensis]|uniref:LuxR family transcriptional regulator n=1 Tax=Eggerthella sinensis TaxID=242230 RepID=A0A3N0J095_9ACTN|nr:LuxR family transcriptional regulator [Eggerthella sinensis]RNM42661.1 LuxR family transcriptional regulator [Eggerthella sinensis]
MSTRLAVGRDRRSMRMVWKTLRLRHIGLAFFWACSMLTFRSSILLQGPADTPELETFVVLVSFVANMTTLFAIAAFMERDPRTFDRLPGWLFCAFIIVGLVVIDVAGRCGNEAVMLALLIGGSALAGVGYGYFWGSWAEYFGRMHPSRTSFYIPVAFLLTAALFLGISLAAEYESAPPLLLMLPLPVLSLLCLRRCHAEVPDGNYARTTNSKRYLTALASLVTLIVASLVLSLLFGLVWEMTVLSVNSVNEAHQAPLVANLVVAVLLIALVLYAHKRLDLALAYRVIVPVIVILFAVLPFFWETSPIVLNAVMSASYGAFDVIIWYMVASSAYDFAVSGFVIGGIVRALSILARLIGIGIGYLLMLIPNSSSLLIVGVSVGAIYVLAALGLFYGTRRKPSVLEAARAEAGAGELTAGETAEHSPAGAVAPVPATPAAPAMPQAPAAPTPAQAVPAAPPSEDAVFEMIAEDFSLTRREAELLPFIARGRSARVIADALFVSENTIRTHTRRILEKTDLHSKQEVIDLIERYR